MTSARQRLGLPDDAGFDDDAIDSVAGALPLEQLTSPEVVHELLAAIDGVLDPWSADTVTNTVPAVASGNEGSPANPVIHGRVAALVGLVRRHPQDAVVRAAYAAALGSAGRAAEAARAHAAASILFSGSADEAAIHSAHCAADEYRQAGDLHGAVAVLEAHQENLGGRAAPSLALDLAGYGHLEVDNVRRALRANPMLIVEAEARKLVGLDEAVEPLLAPYREHVANLRRLAHEWARLVHRHRDNAPPTSTGVGRRVGSSGVRVAPAAPTISPGGFDRRTAWGMAPRGVPAARGPEVEGLPAQPVAAIGKTTPAQPPTDQRVLARSSSSRQQFAALALDELRLWHFVEVQRQQIDHQLEVPRGRRPLLTGEFSTLQAAHHVSRSSRRRHEALMLIAGVLVSLVLVVVAAVVLASTWELPASLIAGVVVVLLALGAVALVKGERGKRADGHGHHGVDDSERRLVDNARRRQRQARVDGLSEKLEVLQQSLHELDRPAPLVPRPLAQPGAAEERSGIDTIDQA